MVKLKKGDFIFDKGFNLFEFIDSLVIDGFLLYTMELFVNGITNVIVKTLPL